MLYDKIKEYFKYFYVFGLCLVFSCSSQVNLPPNDLIEGNIRNTDVTVLVEVTNAEITDSFGGYVEVKITGTVLKNYIGDDLEEGDILHYFEIWEKLIAEEDMKDMISTKQIASLSKKNDKYLIPDVAYSFEYSDKLDKKFSYIIKKIR